MHLIFLMLFIVSIGQTIKAQLCCTPSIPFVISNNSQCSVTLDYKVFDPASSPGCGLLYFQVNITITANSSYTVPYTFNGGEDIEIVVNSLSFPSVNYGSGATGGGPWTPCYPTTRKIYVTSPIAGCATGPNSGIQVWCSNAIIW